MADETQVQDSGTAVAQDASVNVQNVTDNNSSVESTATEVRAETPTEKMIPSSQVSKIAAREARAAAEKARAETLAQIEREKQANQQQGTPTLGGIPQMNEAEFNDRVYRAAQQIAIKNQAERIEREFLDKIGAEKIADPEFAELYDALNIESNPNLVIWANSLDNTAQVVKELAKYPAKYSNILALMNSGSPKLAQRELTNLSSSIKANEEARKQPVSAPPLSQLKPSNIGADNGNMSVSDFMKQSWLRG